MTAAATLAVARAEYARREALIRLSVSEMSAIWRRFDPADLAASYQREAERLFVTLSMAQETAARQADRYVDSALAAQDFGDTGQAGSLNPRAFAGIASDGRDLEGLLLSPVVEARTQLAQGQDAPGAMASGEYSLTRIVATQVADAARSAIGAAIASRTRVGGYVRQLTPPSCSRCAILAGRWYRWNQGFERHPRCDCVHIPVAEDRSGDLRTSPKDYFDSLSAQQQARIFTRDGARAIREGADISQVVNARRGMSVAGTTLEGTTRHGVARAALGSRKARLMPEHIYQIAGNDRTRAVELLRQNGYLR